MKKFKLKLFAFYFVGALKSERVNLSCFQLYLSLSSI